MTPEIKQRIEQIRQGNVPEGYQRIKDGIFPTDWRTQKMKQWVALAECPVTLEDDKKYRLVTVRRGFGGVDLRGEYLGRNILVKNYFRVRKGDFVISKRQIAHGACGVVPESLDGAVVSNEYNVFVPNQGTNIEMFNLMMRLPHYTRLFYLMSDGVHIEKLLFKTHDWMRRQLAMPPIAEQRKIAAILTTQNKMIELKEKRLAEKQQQKKYLMQQLLTGKKRLPGFSGEWKVTRLRNIAMRQTKRNAIGNTNVLTISAQYGLINQAEFFNKAVASDDKSNYFLLEKGDFAYNKSYSNGYPFGAIKRLTRYKVGIVSPLYICFRIKEGSVSGEYLEQYFEAGLMNHEIQAFAQEGARNHGLLNIAVDDFFNSKILIPLLEEQAAIAKIVSTADSEIDLIRQDIEQEKQKKKALMQLLLTGIVRVNV